MKKILLPFLVVVSTSCPVFAAEFSVEKTDKGYDIKIDGELFASYRADGEGTPALWPIIGPTGKEMTRAFPFLPEGKPSEKIDHPHHRSFYFTHGDVNGEDFWMKSPAAVKHRKYVKAEAGKDDAVLVTENDWVGGKGDVLCGDLRTFRFGLVGENRIIDFDVTVTARAEKVVFGDTEEGSFGLRVAGELDRDKKRKDQSQPGGTIVNAEGIKNTEAWGKRSAWVDFYGPIDGDTVGVAILNHPESFRYPTYWHVRPYGLFAANPFGVHDFERKKNEPRLGDHVMGRGDSFTLRYRVVFHKGDPKKAKLQRLHEAYSQEP